LAALVFNDKGEKIVIENERSTLAVRNLDAPTDFSRLAEKVGKLIPSAEVYTFSSLKKSVCLSREGGYLAVLNEQNQRHFVNVFNLSDQSELSSIELPPATVRDPEWCMALASGGSLVAVGVQHQVHVYDPRTKNNIALLEEHQSKLIDLAFDQSGAMLASADEEGIVCLWHPATQELLLTLYTNQKRLSRLALSPTQRWLATGDKLGQVRLWDLSEVQRHLRAAGLDW
jgi:WD40 repeat protein